MKFQSINSEYFGFKNQNVPKDRWISFDGKELRGTIDIDGVLGEKRGVNIVRAESYFVKLNFFTLKIQD